MNLPWRSLATKLTLSYLFLGIAPLLFVGYWTSNKISKSMQQESGEVLRNQASFAAQTLDRNLFERYGDVQVFAAHPDALKSPQAATSAANFFTKTYGYYDLMMVVDRKGRVVACNSVDYQGKPIPSQQLIGQNVADQGWFQACISGRVKSGQSYCGDYSKDANVARVTGGDGLCLSFSAPIYDAAGQPVGAWSNRVSWARLVDQTLAEFRDAGKKIGITTMTTQLLDKEGKAIDSSDPEEAKTNDQPALRDILAGNSSYGLDKSSGRNKILGYTTSQGFSTFPGFQWRLLVRQDFAEANRGAAALVTSTFRTSMLAACIIFLVAWAVVRLVMQPVRECVKLMKSLVEGDLTARSSYRSGDELGEMITAANQAVGQLHQAMQTIAQESQELDLAAQELLDLNQSIGTSTNDVSHQTDSVSSVSEKASENINSVAAAAEEMTYSITEISRSTTQSTQIASRAVEMASSATAIVSRLGESSDSIGKVVRSIYSIAEQTNLLALNATIEAARAGELGKGFAVVASEVKDLARETSSASERISLQIATVQQDIERCIEAIDGTSQIIQEVHDISNTIATAVEEQSATTKEIGRNVSGAANAVAGITTSIAQVAESARCTNSDVEAGLDSLGRLKNLSRKLTGLVSEFRLDQASKPAPMEAPAAHPVSEPTPIFRRNSFSSHQGHSRSA